MAANERTVKKAAIKRATKLAQQDMNRLDAQSARELTAVYESARQDIEQQIQSFARGESTLRLEVLQDLKSQIDNRIGQLASEQDRLLDNGLAEAAKLGTTPLAVDAAAIAVALPSISNDAVQFVHNLVAEDGLQLSDRLWRIERGAREAVGRAIESAIIQGHSASRAAQDFLSRGDPVPADIQAKIDSANPNRVARTAGRVLMVDENNAHENALRVFRTEMNRAYNAAYEQAAGEHPDVIGTRFVLSPNHPRRDICDMHASVNRYGLGPGVYPIGKNPYPAHPNTLSYTEVVFKDEVSDEDREKKEDRIEWLQQQPGDLQTEVLGSTKKRSALKKGILKENEINTPWKVLKVRYERKGIDVDTL